MPPVDDSLLGELPSIGALPPEVPAGTPPPPPPPVIPVIDDANQQAPDEDEDEEEGSPSTTPSSPSTTPSSPGDVVEEPGAPEPGAPEPAAPEITPVDVFATADPDGTFTSTPLLITHQGDVDYDQVRLQLPTFGDVDPQETNESQSTTCTVTVFYSSGPVSSSPVDCGDETAQIDLLTEDLSSGSLLTFTITIQAGTDIALPEPSDVPLSFVTTIDTTEYASENAAVLHLPPAIEDDTTPEQDESQVPTIPLTAEEGTTAGEPTSVAPSTTTETTSNSSSSPDPTSGTTTATATD